MKKIFSFAAIAAVVLTTGCARNEVVNVNPDSPDNIILAPTSARSTRATVAIIDNLEADGFKVYGAINGATSWYSDAGNAIDGNNDHLYNGSKWNFKNPVKWPAATTDYPMNFYAYYASKYTDFQITSYLTSKLEGKYTVQATAATQVDFLAATATTNNKPVSAALSITFKHILSKINYAARVTSNFKAHVMTVGVDNVADTRTYDFKNGVWTNTPAALSTSDCTHDYLYFGAFKSETEFNAIGGNAAPFHAIPDNKSAHLMLMPQNVTDQSWNYPTDKIAGDKTYVYAFYRVTQISPEDKNYLGFEHASSHPDYEGSNLDGVYNGPLYVKAGYPYTLNWEAGKGYTYNLAMPGGVYLSDKYFDEDGNKTDLDVIGGDEGDPIVDKDGFIHLVPKVDIWDDSTAPMDLL